VRVRARDRVGVRARVSDRIRGRVRLRGSGARLYEGRVAPRHQVVRRAQLAPLHQHPPGDTGRYREM